MNSKQKSGPAPHTRAVNGQWTPHNDDILQGDAGKDVLDGDGVRYGGGIVVASQYQGKDTLDGGAGDDHLLGGGANDVLLGGEGNDQLEGDGSHSTSGSQHAATGNFGEDEIDGGAGNDNITGEGNDDLILGGSGDDLIYGDRGFGQQVKAADHGDDEIEGGSGHDVIVGDAGDDILSGDADNDEIYGDDITKEGSTYRLADKDHGEDWIDGGDGADRLVGGGAADEIWGGAGNDALFGEGDGVAEEYSGKDVLYGEAGDDYLRGDKGDDKLYGGAGNDLLEGGDGDDLLDGGAGQDILKGGKGHDTYVFDAADATSFTQVQADGSLLNIPRVMQIEDEEGGNTLRMKNANLANVKLQVFDNAPNDVYVVMGGELRMEAGQLQGTPGVSFTVVKEGLQGKGVGQVVIENEVDGQVQVQEMSFAQLVGQKLDTSNMGGFFERTSVRNGEYLLSGMFNDQLTAEHDGVTLHGGFGNDILVADAQDAVVVVFAGDGQDALTGWGSGTVIELAGNMPMANVRLVRHRERVEISPAVPAVLNPETEEVIEPARPAVMGVSESLRLLLSADGSQYLTLQGRMESLDLENAGIAGLRSRSGETLSFEQLLTRGVAVMGLEGDELTYGSQSNDIFLASSGRNELYGRTGSDTYEVAAGAHVVLQDGQGQNVIRFMGQENFDGLSVVRLANSNDLRLMFVDGTQVSLRDGMAHAGAWTLIAGAAGQAQVQVPLAEMWKEVLGIQVVGNGADEVSEDDEDVQDRVGYTIHDSIVGSDGVDELRGRSGHDVLVGRGGVDFLYGGDGQDTLQGDLGDDLMIGGEGDDMYRFAQGDGVDKIIDIEGRSRIVLGAGLTAQAMQVSAEAQSGSLILSWGSQQIKIAYGLEQAEFDVQFADGALMDFRSVIGQLPTPGDGKTVSGDDGDNELYGTAAGDLLLGRLGKDTLRGLAGDDVLQGGEEDDTYVFARGDGVDKILDDEGISKLVFASSVDLTQVVCTREEIDGAWFMRVQYTVNDAVLVPATQDFDALRFEFAQGGSLSGAQLLLQAYDASKVVAGTALDETILGWTGNDVLAGGGGRNTLIGGKGNDTYQVGAAGEVTVIQDEQGSNTLAWQAPSTSELQYQRVRNDLRIQGEGASNSTTVIQNFFANHSDWQLRLIGGSAQDLRSLATAETLTSAPNQQRELFYSNMLGSLQEWKFSDGMAVKVGETNAGSDAEGNSWNFSVSRQRTEIQNNAAEIVLSAQHSNVLTTTLKAEISKTKVWTSSYLETIEVSRTRLLDTVTVVPGYWTTVYPINQSNGYYDGNATTGPSPFPPLPPPQNVWIPDYTITTPGGWKIRYEEVRRTYSWTTTEITYIYHTEGNVQLITEDLRAGDSDNKITLNGAAALVDAGGGNDVIVGGSSGDWLYGGSGNDRISAGTGNDELLGGTGSDELDGGEGADSMIVDRFDTGWDLVDDSGVEIIRVGLSAGYYGKLDASLVQALENMALESIHLDFSDPWTLSYGEEEALRAAGGSWGWDQYSATVSATKENLDKLMELDRAVINAKPSEVLQGWPTYTKLSSFRLDELIALANGDSNVTRMDEDYEKKPLPRASVTGEALFAMTQDVLKISNVSVQELHASVSRQYVRGAWRQVARLSWGDGNLRVVLAEAGNQVAGGAPLIPLDPPLGASESGAAPLTTGIDIFEFDSGERLTWTELVATLPAGHFTQDSSSSGFKHQSWTALEDDAFVRAVQSDLPASDSRRFLVAEGSVLPAWLSLNALTGQISGTPEQAAVGNFGFDVVVDGGAGLTEIVRVDLSVLNTNDAPDAVGSLGAITLTPGQGVNWLLPQTAFVDVDPGDALSYSVSLADGQALPNWLRLNPVTGVLSGTPPDTFNGSLELEITARDLAGATANLSLTVSVPVAAKEFVTVEDVHTLTEDDTQILGNVLDNDENPSSAALTVSNAGVFEGVAGTLTLAVNGNYSYVLRDPAALQSLQVGQSVVESFVVAVKNGANASGLASSTTLTISVTGSNDAPVLTQQISNIATTEGAAFLITWGKFPAPWGGILGG